MLGLVLSLELFVLGAFAFCSTRMENYFHFSVCLRFIFTKKDIAMHAKKIRKRDCAYYDEKKNIH